MEGKGALIVIANSFEVVLKKTYYSSTAMPSRADAGWVLRLMEKAAILSARKFSECHVMTVGIEKIVFKNPIREGEQAIVKADVIQKGKSSIQVLVEVSSENFVDQKYCNVCSGLFKLVAVDSALNKIFIPDKKDFSLKFHNALQQKLKILTVKPRVSSLKPDSVIVNQADTFVEESDVILPQELNSMNIVFGGDLLNWMAKLSFNVGQKFLGHNKLVAIALDTIEFKMPVFKGDLICMSAQVVQAYQCSFDIKVNMKIFSNQTCLVKEILEMGYFTMVALDNNLKPVLCPNLKK